MSDRMMLASVGMIFILLGLASVSMDQAIGLLSLIVGGVLLILAIAIKGK